MTPKEKAFKLFERFNNPDITNYPYVHNAQQCALIAVDEIIDNWKSEATIQYPYGLVINYWYKVKQEIEKL